MWENVYAILDTISEDEKLIGAYWYDDDGVIGDDILLCIQLSSERLDYEEVPVSLA